MLKLLGYKVKRGVRYIVDTVFLFLVWSQLLHFGYGESCLIKYAPIWVVLALGVYAAASTLLSVISIRNTPEDAQQIEREIVEAKEFLEGKGFDFNFKPTAGEDS
jgi:hypothetical protein